MTNKSSHFKFAKKENSLNNGKKRENDSIKKEKKYSEILIRILLSSKSYNNKIDNTQEKTKANSTKRKTLFNNNTELKIKNKIKYPKFESNKNLKNLNKSLSIKKTYKTEKTKTSQIMSKKINKIKDRIKQSIKLKLENKYSFLNKNNSLSNENTIYSSEKKNYKNYYINKRNVKSILINKNKNKYELNIKHHPKINLDKSTKEKKNKKIFNPQTKKAKNIDNKSPIKQLELINYFSTNKLNPIYNKYIYLTNRDKSEKNLNETDNIKSSTRLTKKKILYINLSKSNVRTENKTINIHKKYGIIKGSMNSTKKKLLILVDDFNQKNNCKQNNNMTFSLGPKRLIDQIRTIKKLNIINKSSI